MAGSVKLDSLSLRPIKCTINGNVVIVNEKVGVDISNAEEILSRVFAPFLVFVDVLRSSLLR